MLLTTGSKFAINANTKYRIPCLKTNVCKGDRGDPPHLSPMALKTSTTKSKTIAEHCMSHTVVSEEEGVDTWNVEKQKTGQRYWNH